MWSLPEVGGVGSVLGLFRFIGISKALSKHSRRVRCLNGVIYIHIWLFCLYLVSCVFTGDVLSVWSLHEVCVVGWALGFARCFKRMS